MGVVDMQFVYKAIISSIVYLYLSCYKTIIVKKLYSFIFLVFLTTASFAATVDTLVVRSAVMERSYKAAVVLPASYTKTKSAYPVLYLLHGAYGHFGDWLIKPTDKMLLHQLADQYNIIIVTPEGGSFSFYLDSPENKASQFETYITKDVINAIDQTYRTVNKKEGRAITGLSMGGHGALYLSAKHPELFIAAGSMSGAVDMESMLKRDSSAHVKKLMEPVFGSQSGSPELYAAHAVVNMVEAIGRNGIALIIDCGVDDFLFEANRELHSRLIAARVPHDYTERPGAHTWEYWTNALPYQLLYFRNVFVKNGITVP